MRLFIAVDPPAEVAEKLAAIQRTLADTKAAVRWVDPKDYHITVKFLGEVQEGLLAELTGRLTHAAAEVAPFDVEVEGVDKYAKAHPLRGVGNSGGGAHGGGHGGPVRVILSRVISPDQRLTRLHRKIDSAVGGMGLPMDARELSPHITLGRVKSNHGLNRLLRLIEKHDLDFFGAFTVAQVKLYQSIPAAELGASMRHVVLHTAPLQPTAQPAQQNPPAPPAPMIQNEPRMNTDKH